MLFYIIKYVMLKFYKFIEFFLDSVPDLRFGVPYAKLKIGPTKMKNNSKYT